MKRTCPICKGEYEDGGNSWEKPIAQEILDFVTHMEGSFAVRFDLETGWFNGKEKAKLEAYRDAYKTVREHIEKEIKLRAKVENLKESNND